MKSIIAITLLAATSCALDAGLDDEALETTTSELQYCPDGELCEPYTPPSTAKPDLAPGTLSTPCRFIASTYPRGYKIGFRVYNNGTAASQASMARVQFRVWYNDYTSAPLDVSIPALEPGQYSTQYVLANTYCWNSIGGCDITVIADPNDRFAERSETNNTLEWHCAKP